MLGAMSGGPSCRLDSLEAAAMLKLVGCCSDAGDGCKLIGVAFDGVDGMDSAAEWFPVARTPEEVPVPIDPVAEVLLDDDKDTLLVGIIGDAVVTLPEAFLSRIRLLLTEFAIFETRASVLSCLSCSLWCFFLWVLYFNDFFESPLSKIRQEKNIQFHMNINDICV